MKYVYYLTDYGKITINKYIDDSETSFHKYDGTMSYGEDFVLYHDESRTEHVALMCDELFFKSYFGWGQCIDNIKLTDDFYDEMALKAREVKKSIVKPLLGVTAIVLGVVLWKNL